MWSQSGKQGLSRTKYENLALAAPIILFLLLFLGFPALVSLVYSFSEVSFETLRSPRLSGVTNYFQVISDLDFWRSAWFSFRFALLTAFTECFLGLFLAIFLAPLIEKRTWLLAILMMPIMVAPAMVGLMYRLILHEFIGSVPHYLFLWLGGSPAFLSHQNVFLTLLVIEILQWTPFALLMFYLAYESIPKAMREAAQVDNARGLSMLWLIDLPQMFPTLVIAFLIRFIDGFRIFDNIFALMGSGAGGATTSISIYIYLTFFSSGDIGKAVAASMILLAVSLLVIILVGRLAHRRPIT